MITVTFDSSNASQVLINKHGEKQTVPTTLAAVVLKNLKLNTDIKVKSANTKVSKHSGQYFLLFLQEYEEVCLLYLDTQGALRQVFYGPDSDVIKALYFNVADDTEVKVLKTSNKQAYRVVAVNGSGEDTVLTIPYKNKSSQVVTKTYLDLLEAIKLAALNYRKQSGSVTYKVITPKNTVLFQVG